MAIFGKPIIDITSDDLQDLLAMNAVENVLLEFKREVPSKDETLKKLSSFANSLGGFMVIGAEAGSKDGRITGLPGVDIQQGYKQKVVQWCFEGASPPLVIDVSDPVNVQNGRVCYVLHV